MTYYDSMLLVAEIANINIWISWLRGQLISLILSQVILFSS